LIQLLSIFFTTLIVSAWGSVQPGLVNTFIATSARTFGKRKAILLATIAVLPEFLYAAICVYFNQWLESNELFSVYVNSIFPLVMIVLGTIMYFKNDTIPVSAKSKKIELKGFLLGLANIQLPLYWLGMVMVFNHLFGWQFESFDEKAAFISGTGLGAFLMLLVWIWIFDLLANSRFQHLPFNKIFGFLLVASGIVVLIRNKDLFFFR